ncbi:multicopper oxidase domain-containing protein [Inquilinus limosus]|uniref:multicopper oxidase family protein n=1 Tax=Inquilinus limosus TaxID=171674 RepID=UPI003F156488
MALSLTRRGLIAAGLGVGAFGLGRLALGGEGPELPALPELPVDRSEPRLARARLTAAPIAGDLAGNLLGYAGRYPGPLLRLREGERLHLTLENRTGMATNLHFHGLSVEPGGSGDNPWIVVPQGERFRYEFDVPPGNAGLHWYHPHLHGRVGLSGFAQMRGLIGPILVERGEPDGLPPADDRILVLHDMAIASGQVRWPRLTDWAVGHEGTRLLVNGVERPRITARRAWLRLRLVAAANARYWRLAPSDGGPLFLVAQDGALLAAPEAVPEIFLPPGARAEVMIPVAGRLGFDLLIRPYDRMGSVHTGELPLIRIRPDTAETAVPDLPSRLADWPRFDPAAAARRREIPIALLTICGRLYDGGRVDLPVAAGSSEIWTLRNVDLMDHPVHLHTWRFEALALNGAPVARRARLDTHNLRPGDALDIGIRFDRFRGRSLFHCHIVEHADQGMMAVVEAA